MSKNQTQETPKSAGLSDQEARTRLQQYGPNELAVRKRSPLLWFLSYFWGPIAWMIEIAGVLSLVVKHWIDFGIIAALLLFNALIGFWQEHQAANAIEALKKQLALKTRVKRNDLWKEIPARELVPGDIVLVRLGDIIPADVKLTSGPYLTVDQAVLTGESLPVDKAVGSNAYSGSIVRQGEMEAEVTATGTSTLIGKTAFLTSTAKPVSHFQRAVLQIGDFVIYLSLGLSIILAVTQLARGDSWLTLLQFTLVLVVAAIPAAMPAVLSVTMAVGARVLAKRKAIVTRLESIEEMAGMDVLCADKTGTLTQNKLTLSDPVLFNTHSKEEALCIAALASERENSDAIDQAILTATDASQLERYALEGFHPFDPICKRTEAQICGPNGLHFSVTKGAPQVILDLCKPVDTFKAHVETSIEVFANKGYRTLGVASKTERGEWQFLALLPLFDPPREDSRHTIGSAQRHGIAVRMVTGDNIAIARQVSRQLGLGTEVTLPEKLDAEETSGFAQVLPKHKLEIVRTLQRQGHIVGMTGDGVNDAPALKQADVGIAVSGATDAARAAAGVVLTTPGLSIIINAIEEARRIFERMNSYAIYRITETIRILFFIVLSILAFNFYPITAVMVILLAFLNDLPIMAIAYDNTWLDPKPVRWDMRRVLSVSTVLGLVGVVESFLILVLAKLWLHLTTNELQTLIFLKLSLAGHLTLFVARIQGPFFSQPHPQSLLFWSLVGTPLLVTLVAGLGFGIMTPIAWWLVGAVWLYCLVWLFVEDGCKLLTYRHLRLQSLHHHRFLWRIKQSIHPSHHKPFLKKE